MKFTSYLLFVVCGMMFLSSCNIQKQIPYYLQNASDSTIISQSVPVAELRIQPNDILTIEIASKSTQPEKSDQIFNDRSTGGAGSGGSGGGSGYLVDKEGFIEHVQLGKIRAGGLTRTELAELIREKLVSPVELLTDPTVRVRISNFRVNMLGMDGNTRSITANNERLTILEAIAQSGGITDMARRDKIRVIREQDGKRTVGYVDLTKADFYNSEYYFLRQNDVLIIEPTAMRYRDLEQNRINQRVGFVFTFVTLALTVVSLLVR